MLWIKRQDLRRATLPLRSGNEGWIGVSPTGDRYHVVVPVDTQIARGVMACNRPADGTPFGGYSSWLYFRCPPYEDLGDEEAAREERIRQTARELILLLKAYAIQAEIAGDSAQVERPAPTALSDGPDNPQEVITAESNRRRHEPRSENISVSDARDRCEHCHAVRISCQTCSRSWNRLAEFIRDPSVILDRYRVCLDDFGKGEYVFTHSCGGRVEVGVWMFARAPRKERSLLGTHACPGMCYYETSFRPCSAACEGSSYRRIAIKLKSRS